MTVVSDCCDCCHLTSTTWRQLCHVTTRILVRWQVRMLSSDNYSLDWYIVTWHIDYLSSDTYVCCQVTTIVMNGILSGDNYCHDWSIVTWHIEYLSDDIHISCQLTPIVFIDYLSPDNLNCQVTTYLTCCHLTTSLVSWLHIAESCVVTWPLVIRLSFGIQLY